jgi:hypothetical protein
LLGLIYGTVQLSNPSSPELQAITVNPESPNVPVSLAAGWG